MSNRGSDDAKRANDEAFVPALQTPIRAAQSQRCKHRKLKIRSWH
jgi:hypothetical protein